jgi:hypothetical protein
MDRRKNWEAYGKQRGAISCSIMHLKMWGSIIFSEICERYAVSCGLVL